MESKRKFQIGDKVRITKGNYKGAIGLVTSYADYKIWGKLTYNITISNTYNCPNIHAHIGDITPQVSYEMEKYTKEDPRDSNTKYIYEFTGNPAIKFAGENIKNLINMADKVTVDGVVIRNRYGESIITEKPIYLTLEEAKEMYKNGGKEKELALKAYSIDELIHRPTTWEEYCQLNVGKYHWIIDDGSNITKRVIHPNTVCHPFNQCNVLPTKEDTEAFLAYMQLITLRKEWIQDWEPDWHDVNTKKWCIKYSSDQVLRIDFFYDTLRPLSFPTEEMAKEFKNCFSELLCQAKGLF